jgi:hypothetical protein
MIETVLNIIGDISNIAGVVGAGFSVAVYLKMKMLEAKRLQEIPAFLINEKGTLTKLPLALLRKDVTRAEILGRLGMIPMKEAGKRFSLKGISSPEFLTQVNSIAEGKIDTLVINATSAEIDQFDL